MPETFHETVLRHFLSVHPSETHTEVTLPKTYHPQDPPKTHPLPTKDPPCPTKDPPISSPRPTSCKYMMPLQGVNLIPRYSRFLFTTPSFHHSAEMTSGPNPSLQRSDPTTPQTGKELAHGMSVTLPRHHHHPKNPHGAESSAHTPQHTHAQRGIQTHTTRGNETNAKIHTQIKKQT